MTVEPRVIDVLVSLPNALDRIGWPAAWHAKPLSSRISAGSGRRRAGTNTTAPVLVPARDNVDLPSDSSRGLRAIRLIARDLNIPRGARSISRRTNEYRYVIDDGNRHKPNPPCYVSQSQEEHQLVQRDCGRICPRQRRICAGRRTAGRTRLTPDGHLVSSSAFSVVTPRLDSRGGRIAPAAVSGESAGANVSQWICILTDKHVASRGASVCGSRFAAWGLEVGCRFPVVGVAVRRASP